MALPSKPKSSRGGKSAASEEKPSARHSEGRGGGGDTPETSVKLSDDVLPYFIVFVPPSGDGGKSRYLICQAVGVYEPSPKFVSQDQLDSYFAGSPCKVAALPVYSVIGMGAGSPPIKPPKL